MKHIGLAIFVVALLIHIVFFVVPRHYSPASVAVAAFGLLGVALMILGKRRKGNSP
jgi:drug/metabolite transporter (DMT)-like permease